GVRCARASDDDASCTVLRSPVGVPVRVDTAYVLVFLVPLAAVPEISTLSLHDALPIYVEQVEIGQQLAHGFPQRGLDLRKAVGEDRKSTRLNSSHVEISYAVFCLKKKTK